MSNIIGDIQAATAEVVNELYDAKLDLAKVNVSATRKDMKGDYTIVVFPFTKMAGKKPRRLPLPLAHVIAVLNTWFKLGLPLTRGRLGFYTTKATYPITKANRILGWQPRISTDEGMRLSEVWLKEVGKI